MVAVSVVGHGAAHGLQESLLLLLLLLLLRRLLLLLGLLL